MNEDEEVLWDTSIFQVNGTSMFPWKWSVTRVGAPYRRWFAAWDETFRGGNAETKTGARLQAWRHKRGLKRDLRKGTTQRSK